VPIFEAIFWGQLWQPIGAANFGGQFQDVFWLIWG
jgi:hypothetical protein